MTEAARRPRGARTALVIISLLLVLWATLAPRGGAWMDVDAGRFCLWCGEARVTDALANVALFIPLGFALVLSGMRPLLACGACLLLTLGIETTQFFGVPAGRIASVSDAITNTVGGVAGASLACWRRPLLFPHRVAAARLACLWTLLCVLLFGATAWAVSAPAAPDTGAAPLPKPSALLMVVPGSGWFHGILLGTLVDGVELPHRGTGPIIVEAAATSRRSVRVAMAGRDERSGAVAFLYLHAPGDWRPALQLEQRGDAVAVRGSNRSAKLGFASLEAVVQDAFATSSMKLADTTLVVAHTTKRELSLVVERGAHRWSSVLLRTPTLGWTLAQSLVRTGSPFANALTALWLLLLLVPLGYWGWWAGSLRAYVTLGAAVTIATAIVVAVRMFDIAFPPLWQWCVLAAGVATGMLLGQLTFASARGHHGTVDG